MDNYFYINKKKIYYQKFGNGKPLIMLHGITSSSNTWKHIVKTMEKYRTIIALDLRGHGKSDHFSTYKWVDYSEDIVVNSKEIMEVCNGDVTLDYKPDTNMVTFTLKLPLFQESL